MSGELILSLANEIGFSDCGFFEPVRIKIMSEVRDMCAADSCGKYGKSWSCPPACGTLEEIKEKISAYAKGAALQTIEELEDQFDFETMQEAEARHKERLLELGARLFDLSDHIILSSGACTLCRECTYPESPCRFPDRMMPSMEAYGLMVSDICAASGLRYHNGEGTVTFTGCVLF